MQHNLEEYLKNSPIIKNIDFSKKKISYKNIVQHSEISVISGKEELVRAYLITRLVKDLGYKAENIEIEKKYDIGRPKVNKPRIDIVLRDAKKNAFLYIETKSPDDFIKDQDEIIEKQLFNLASQEKGQGKEVKYLMLYTFDQINENFKDKTILIDYEKFNSFEKWSIERNFSDSIPSHYNKAQKEPYIKDGKKDLEKNFSHQQLDSLRKNLHNVLWGGGGTDDNDIFSSLVNIILCKIQDESEKNKGQKYDFQIFSLADDSKFETNEDLFSRINELYKRALKQRLNITDNEKLKKSYVVDENKFSLSKLKYTVAQLERYSFVDGKNSVSGKDILGDFFEGIIREGFKQSKGQFFTHINVVRFLLWGLKLDELAINKLNQDLEMPYVIDPSAGSGTFLIEYMRFLTENLKRRFNHKIKKTRDIEDKFHNWFLPDNRENKWAKDYIYGVEHNFNLGTATKVNMILHGDGASNIFVKDGLLPFKFYEKETQPNVLNKSFDDDNYFNKKVNGQFDVVISNPPFSVVLDKDTEKNLKNSFIFGEKKNSENYFIERYYQLLKENGRLGVVLPDSVYDTTENKYIRLFMFKYFKFKAVVSLPQLTFQPYTSTKTSLLFLQKKTSVEIKSWNEIWNKHSNIWSNLKTRTLNLIGVYKENKDIKKYPSIANLKENEKKEILKKMLKNDLVDEDLNLSTNDMIKKYSDELLNVCKIDNDTKDTFGFVNTWWVFGEVSNEINYPILMSEIENVGYKRTKRGENKLVNELFRTNQKGEVLVDDGIKKTTLDYLREINWE